MPVIVFYEDAKNDLLHNPDLKPDFLRICKQGNHEIPKRGKRKYERQFAKPELKRFNETFNS